MTDSALISVLGAVAYGERKAHDKALERASAASDDGERRVWRTIAAEELRHHKGFVRRLEALGADPERAMAPFKAALDAYHERPVDTDEVAGAVADLLGEGIATDLLGWLRKVADPDTAAFVDTVLADEAGHEARAAAEVRRLMASSPAGRRRAAAGARHMLLRMARSGAGRRAHLLAFLGLGRAHELVLSLAAGYARRLGMLGIGPLGTLRTLGSLGPLGPLGPLGR
jgi:DNA-binding ferritin-like protein (Dps family)